MEEYRTCPPGAYSLDKTEGCTEGDGGMGAELKTGHGKGEREKPCDKWHVYMLWSQHSVAMVGKVGMSGRSEEGQSASPCCTAACSMHQVLPDLISQVSTGPSAATVAVAEGTTGTAGPSSPAAAADEPPDAHQQTAQQEQRAQHCSDDHANTSGVCREKERPVRLSAA